MKDHCDSCAPEYNECWNDGLKCIKQPKPYNPYVRYLEERISVLTAERDDLRESAWTLQLVNDSPDFKDAESITVYTTIGILRRLTRAIRNKPLPPAETAGKSPEHPKSSTEELPARDSEGCDSSFGKWWLTTSEAAKVPMEGKGFVRIGWDAAWHARDQELEAVRKENLEFQEEVVAALHEFAHENPYAPDSIPQERNGKKTPVSLEAVGLTLKRIMDAAGLKIQDIQ